MVWSLRFTKTKVLGHMSSEVRRGSTMLRRKLLLCDKGLKHCNKTTWIISLFGKRWKDLVSYYTGRRWCDFRGVGLLARLKESDHNSHYFHKRAMWQAMKNHICRIQKSDGSWCDTRTEMERMAALYFKEVYTKDTTLSVEAVLAMY